MSTLVSIADWIVANPDEAAGAALLAFNGKHARWGWVAYLFSNLALIHFAARHGHGGLLALQLGFFFTTALGTWQWILRRLVCARRSPGRHRGDTA
jgi:hypothetical protein